MRKVSADNLSISHQQQHHQQQDEGEEYNPLRPNDYEKLVAERRRREAEEREKQEEHHVGLVALVKKRRRSLSAGIASAEPESQVSKHDPMHLAMASCCVLAVGSSSKCFKASNILSS